MSERTTEKSRADVVDVDLGLPERKYFKIGEVAELLGVETHVLRYWETQFSQIKPHKARSGHRLYRRREVETLLVIKDLLHIQRFTIAGARQALRQQGTNSLLPRAAEQLTLPPTSSLQARHKRVVESTLPGPADTTTPRDADDDLDDSLLDESVVDESALEDSALEDDFDDQHGNRDQDGDDDDDDDVLELHLADPLPGRGPGVGEIELDLEARDGDDLDDALAAQLTEQLATRRGTGVSRLDVERGEGGVGGVGDGTEEKGPRASQAAALRVSLQETRRELQSLLGRLGASRR